MYVLYLLLVATLAKRTNAECYFVKVRVQLQVVAACKIQGVNGLFKF